MGTWGTGAFESDAALDWLELFKRDAAGALDEALSLGASASDFYDAAVIVAGAEVVAALLGRPSEDLPSEVTEWVERRMGLFNPDLASRLRTMVVDAGDPTGAAVKSWFTIEARDQWLRQVDDLAARLAGQPA
jgi:hypothetical protein